MTMGLERFERLVDAFGADPRRWPEAERAAAEAFLAGHAEARARVEAAAELDGLLAFAPDIEPSDLLRYRVLRAAPAKAPGRASISQFGWLSGAGWTAAAAAGVLVGVSLGQQMNQARAADEVLEQASAWSADEAEYYG